MEKLNCCEFCRNLEYDEVVGVTYCSVGLDEDEMARFLSYSHYSCPYFFSDNEYDVVKKQN